MSSSLSSNVSVTTFPRSQGPNVRLVATLILANRYLTVISAIDILTVRGKEPWPADPLVHLRDYYGEERSPQWDLVDQLKEENAKIVEELPEMEKKIEDLQKELKQLQLQNRALGVYTQSMDADKSNALGYKSIIVKLSGFAKFDLDTKINKDQFHQFVDGMCRKGDSGELDEDKYEAILQLFEKAYREPTPPFAGNLEDETYKSIVNRMRSFVPQ